MVMQHLERVYGLNIVKNIIDMHNGTVEIDSAIDKGTTVTILLEQK